MKPTSCLMQSSPRSVSFPRSVPVFPFSAILGQERMKLALILNAVEPRVGGVLIRGEKGTAKSTAVRALAALLPHGAVRAGCAFHCDSRRPEEWCPSCRARPSVVEERRRAPVVTLPLNATEDRVLGGIDFSATLRRGSRVFQPGLLARAHGGILYVDEVNLLDDHLVDVILDAAVSGENVIEREGTAFRHAARFSLVGTMNPEEGALRPQLLDRFGLCVEVESERDVSLRVELVERRGEFDLDPAAFTRRFEQDEARTAQRLARAREVLPGLRVRDTVRAYIGELTKSHNVAGHRADLVIERAACAHAAWNGRRSADMEDVLAVAEMALCHRRREALPPPPPPPPRPPEDEREEPPEPPQESEPPPDEPQRESQEPREGEEPSELHGGESRDGDDSRDGEAKKHADAEGRDQRFEVGETFAVRKLVPPDDRLLRRGSGRRSRTRTSQKQGRYVRSRMGGSGDDLALDATLRAAAPYQKKRRRDGGAAIVIQPGDWRHKVREKRVGCFILFVVDASGSMGARGRMGASKGAVMSLLLDAYQKRDRVALVAFRRREAEVLLPPTSSIELAARLLSEMPVGGRTPLSAGLSKAYEMLRTRLRHDPNLRPLVVVITDGKSNVALGQGSPRDEALRMAVRLGEDPRVHWIVVDTEEPGIVRFELARRLSTALGAQYFRIDGLRATDLVNVVKGHTA